MKKNEHWRWMDKNKPEQIKPKVIYKGDSDMIKVIEDLEDTIVQKDKKIIELNTKIKELESPFDYSMAVKDSMIYGHSTQASLTQDRLEAAAQRAGTYSRQYVQAQWDAQPALANQQAAANQTTSAGLMQQRVVPSLDQVLFDDDIEEPRLTPQPRIRVR